MKKFIAVAAASLLSVGVANAETTTADKVVEKAKTATFDLLDKDVTKVTFANGSSDVTDAERSTLRSVVNAVRDDSKVEKVIVVAWADAPMPANDDVELDKVQRDLAKTRAENVERILEELGVANVDSYTMAERPSWFGKVFRTDDAQIKESMEGKRVHDADDAAIAETLKSKGGPSTAVVIVQRARTDVSH